MGLPILDCLVVEVRVFAQQMNWSSFDDSIHFVPLGQLFFVEGRHERVVAYLIPFNGYGKRERRSYE